MQRRQATLKEKLTEHYHKRDFKPKKATASKLGVVIFLVMLFSLLIEGLTILLPHYFEESDGKYSFGYRWTQLLSIWLSLGSGIHWCRTHFSQANRVTKTLKADHFSNMIETPPGWKACVTCQLDAPPRSHHCTLCNFCILKRDHHCFFTGSCIGYHNQRGFVIFCIYSMAGCALAIYMQISYLNTAHPLFSSSALFYFPLVTIWQYLIGTTTFTHLFVLIHVYFTVLCFGGSTFFFFWQLLVLSRGQTSYEAWKQIMVYRSRSIFSNLYSALGSPLHFLMCFFVPISLELPGDGVKWTIEPKAEKGH